MSLITWDSRYEIGLPEIDAEHKVFVSIIQRIEEAVKVEDKEHVIKLIEELLKYADFHFCSEENIMIREEYPDYHWHKKLHQHLLVELRDRIQIIKYEYIDFDVLLKFLVAWFKGHTQIEDKKFAEYVNKKLSI